MQKSSLVVRAVGGAGDTRVVFGLSGSRTSSRFLLSRSFSSGVSGGALAVEASAAESSLQLRLVGTAAAIPHPQKAHRGGEDASFVSSDGMAMGVFDGVGSWADVGVDPGLYARSLAVECEACHTATASSNPVTLLEHAYVNSRTITGSATACVVTLDAAGILRAVTVGDSVFMVIRDGQMLFRQRELQHGFNFPFQLGLGSRDTPAHGARATVEVRQGDVVLLATDGVTDNLFDEEIVAIVAAGGSATDISQRVAKAASVKANSSDADTPFARAGYGFKGGKLDDITVAVAVVEVSAFHARL